MEACQVIVVPDTVPHDARGSLLVMNVKLFVPEAVATLFNSSVVELVIDNITVRVGIPVPVTESPTARAAVVAVVTVASVLVVVQESTRAAAGADAP